jgi:AmmeMemoRadiSam system protein B
VAPPPKLSAMDCPQLRPIQAAPVPGSGGRQFEVRDASGISPVGVRVPANVMFILSLFDGRHSLRDVQVAYTRRFGDLLMTDQLRRLVDQLDQALLLEGDRFQQAWAAIKADFAAQPVRAASHAGTAYDADPERLAAALDAVLAPVADQPYACDRPPAAMIAPHIDLARGGACYGLAYRELAKADPPAEVYVILGTSHAGGETPLIGTEKDFETPLGTAAVDRDFVRALAGRLEFDLCSDEVRHRGEHSIEFQVVWLQHALRERGSPTIVPLLCSGFHQTAGGLADPSAAPQVRASLDALRQTIVECGKRVCVIAGADLSHVGARFGDAPPTLADLDALRRTDLEMLEHVRSADAAAFYADLATDGDRRHICGFPPIYAMLRAASPGEGHLLGYDRALERDTGSVVTFASLAYDP